MINRSDFQNLEEAVETLERKDDLLLCSFSKQRERSKPTDPLRLKFEELLSSSKTLRSIHFWHTIITKDLSKSLTQNGSIVEIILNWCNGLSLDFDNGAEQRLYLLKGLERKESLNSLSILNDTVEDEVVDFIISSLRMRETLVVLSCLVLKTSKQLSAPYFRFSRLTKLSVKWWPVESKGAIFLRGICFCKCLKQLKIENVSPLMLLMAFPKWNGELQGLFPLTRSLVFKYPSIALLDRKLLGNVAHYLHAGTKALPMPTFARVFSKIVRNDNSVDFSLSKPWRAREGDAKIKNQARLAGRVHLNKDVRWKSCKGSSVIHL